MLVGEDSLEANVGHLAALSGGDIYVAAGDDLADSLVTAIGALRASFGRPSPIVASLDRVQAVRGNAVLEAEWRLATEPVSDASSNRSVAAMAASLALPVLDKERAALLAEAEGLVTHLTSLVLVDEAGEVQEGIPATRKIALPRPGGVVYHCRTAPLDFDTECEDESLDGPNIALLEVARNIDWDISPNQLLAGDLSALDPQDAGVIEQAAALPEIIAFAKRMHIERTVLVIALLAQSRASGNRSAARIAKSVLGNQLTDELLKIAELIGLV